MASKTEDQVRDEANLILKFNEKEKDITQGTGQITTFNQLGFKGVNDKPDGWYLPKNVKPLTKFDGLMWGSLLESATIKDKDTIVFKFKDGTEING